VGEDRETRVDGAAMRRVLGHFATGVTVVTAEDGEGPVGMVANSFTSVSLEPPLVLFCAGVESETWPRVRAAERFCVNVLAHDQQELAVSFARKGTDRYQGVELVEREEGPPRLAGAIAHIECVIGAEHPAGDHTIVVGEVRELAVADEGAEQLGEPLIFYRGGFTTARERAE
jgi:3-hydroxy-9,10-secoandrosta-1,3,5(10)-triene-9,17-dione monooxygenase reductase component